MTIGFAAPWLLSALAVLPVLWWLLRVTPPAARRQVFPALSLLMGLEATPNTAARTPWWLLWLRILAAALIIISLAGPVRNAPHPAMAHAPVVLVLDNGWAAAPDWQNRLRAATAALAQAGAPATPSRLLATAPDRDGAAIALGPETKLGQLPASLAAAHPMPWPPDRAAAAAALQAMPRATRIIYLADGIATKGDAAFERALDGFDSVTELTGNTPPLLLRAADAAPDQLTLHLETLPGRAVPATVHALGAAGETLAETSIVIPASGDATAPLVLPPDLRNRLVAIKLGDQPSAGAMLLLDEASRRRPVGLLSRGGQDQPLIGPLYFLHDALDAAADVQDGNVAALLSRPVSVIIAADQKLSDPADRAALTGWVRHGGELIRFAGPAVAAETGPDALLPVTLLAGDRALGGAMSWSRPARLAPFPPGSPFAGLDVPPDVRISRQVLAQPGEGGSAATWASLQDGTPLVTEAAFGAGRLVLFHVTANADWSNLPLSGLFPDMLHRLVELAAGVKPQADNTPLAPYKALDGFGQLSTPGAAAKHLTAIELATAKPGPAHPPGLYGPADATRAFNLGAALPRLAPAAKLANAVQQGLAGAPSPTRYGPPLLAAALVLLAADLLVGLSLRGLLGTAASSVLMLISIHASAAPPAMPSLATHLAFVITNDSQADGISRAGLKGLSDDVNQRTAASLADPVGIDPAQDDLSFYPLIYWPILSDTQIPAGAALASLDDYMANGGIIVFDTRDAQSPDPGAQAALRRIGAALTIPPLAQLTGGHVLSHSFYLLHDWPGRLDGAPVWVAAQEDHANDSVSPVIIGAGDWAAAWAVDDSGANPYDCTPGGESQRLLAYRFGVNLVIYALTGNYKADQVHVPELLHRMGGDAPPDTEPDAP